MSRKDKAYIVEICYPDSEEGIYKLRKRAIESWDKMLKEYIKFLSISEKEKKKLYEEMMNYVVHYKEIDEN